MASREVPPHQSPYKNLRDGCTALSEFLLPRWHPHCRKTSETANGRRLRNKFCNLHPLHKQINLLLLSLLQVIHGIIHPL